MKRYRGVNEVNENKRAAMKKKILMFLSNGALIIGAIIGIYAMADIYFLKSRLPPGTCVVTKNRPLLYIAIVLCCVSFILSFFEHKRGKIEPDNMHQM